jgi:hypothetical protein
MRWGFGWLCLTWTIAVLTGGMSLLFLPIVALTWTAYATFFATLGLWCSVRNTSSTKAMIAAIEWGVGLGGGHWIVWWCCAACLMPMGPMRELEHVLIFQAGVLTPPFVMAVIPFRWADLGGFFNPAVVYEIAFWSLVGPWCWVLAGRRLFSITVERLKRDINEEGVEASRAAYACAGHGTACMLPILAPTKDTKGG